MCYRWVWSHIGAGIIVERRDVREGRLLPRLGESADDEPRRAPTSRTSSGPQAERRRAAARERRVLLS